MPDVSSSFTVSQGATAFTIGSCFAREIEEALIGFDLPTTGFAVPKSEWQGRPNGLLNEYNPGTMAQRISWAIDGTSTVDMAKTYIGPEDRTLDLFLAVGEPVTLRRAKARRAEIDAIYSHLLKADLVIITLGLVECWFDQESGHWLNRMPPPPEIRRNSGRYSFCRLDSTESARLLEPAIDALLQNDRMRVIITVSPVPLQTTFTGQDAVTANSYSKAILRVTAEHLRRRFEGKVDYFPSYEIVLSGGKSAFGKDNVHVHAHVVKAITNYMTSIYVS